MAWLLSAFAVSAVLLAAIGVFGVMSHAVSQRTREIGVRMAIGASPYRVLGAILGEGLTQVGFGLAARRGVVAADRAIARRIALWRVSVEHRPVSDRRRVARQRLAIRVPRTGTPRDANRPCGCPPG